MTLVEIVDIFGTLHDLSSNLTYRSICQKYIIFLQTCLTTTSPYSLEEWQKDQKPELLTLLDGLRTDTIFSAHPLLIKAMENDVRENGVTIKAELVDEKSALEFIQQLLNITGIHKTLFAASPSPCASPIPYDEEKTSIFMNIEQAELAFAAEDWINVISAYQTTNLLLQKNYNDFNYSRRRKLIEFHYMYLQALSKHAACFDRFSDSVSAFRQLILEIDRVRDDILLNDLLIQNCLGSVLTRLNFLIVSIPPAAEENLIVETSPATRNALTDFEFIIHFIHQYLKTCNPSPLHQHFANFQQTLAILLLRSPIENPELRVIYLKLSHRLMLNYHFLTDDKKEPDQLYKIHQKLYQALLQLTRCSNTPLATKLSHFHEIIKFHHQIQGSDERWMNNRKYFIKRISACIDILAPLVLSTDDKIALLNIPLNEYNTLGATKLKANDLKCLVRCKENISALYCYAAHHSRANNFMLSAINQYYKAYQLLYELRQPYTLPHHLLKPTLGYLVDSLLYVIKNDNFFNPPNSSIPHKALSIAREICIQFDSVDLINPNYVELLIETHTKTQTQRCEFIAKLNQSYLANQNALGECIIEFKNSPTAPNPMIFEPYPNATEYKQINAAITLLNELDLTKLNQFTNFIVCFNKIYPRSPYLPTLNKMVLPLENLISVYSILFPPSYNLRNNYANGG
jgi:hypothetical protein